MKVKLTWGAVLLALVAAGILGKGVYDSYCRSHPNDSACPAPSPSPTAEPSPSASPSASPTVTPTATPAPTATPTEAPSPTPRACRGGVCPPGRVYINAKKHGKNNFDSTMRCRDQRYCEASTGIKGTFDCALGNEGTEDRRVCEEHHAPGCHRWYYLDPADSQYHQCLPAQHPVASCDHYDQWAEWRYSDPNCKHEKCPTEYNPYTGYCATYEVTHKDGSKHREPIAGFQVIPHGATKLIACGWATTEKVCSNPLTIDQ